MNRRRTRMLGTPLCLVCLAACQVAARPHTMMESTALSTSVFFLPAAAGQSALNIPAVTCYVSPLEGSGVGLVMARESEAGPYCSAQFDVAKRRWSVAFAGMQQSPHAAAVTVVY